MKHRSRKSLALLAGALALGGCELDLQDPNRPTEDQVFSTADGILGVASGLQAQYADELRDPIWVVGLVTDEIGVGTGAFANYIELDSGNRITRGYFNTQAFDPFSGMYAVVKLADDLLRTVPETTVIGEGTRSGILALARLYKAMALGNLIQLYEQVPLDVGPDRAAPLRDRQAVLTEVLRLLQEARTQIQASAPSEAFRTRVLAPGYSLAPVIDAMIARYALIAGDYDLAIEAAQRVPLGSLNTLQFSNTDPNPLWNLWYNSGNAYLMRPEQSFRLQAEEGDRRVAYWVQPANLQGAVTRLDELNQYRGRTDALPLYLPDEMRLIQAEAYARRDQLAQARTLINAVRTQCTASVAEPVACLPALPDAQLATRAQILQEILRQRRYELYLTGLRYEDLRRFGQPLKYAWLPIPQGECDRNPAVAGACS